MAATAPLQPVADIGWRVATPSAPAWNLVDNLTDAKRLAELIADSQQRKSAYASIDFSLRNPVDPVLTKPFTLVPRLNSRHLPVNRRATLLLFDSPETAISQAAWSRRHFFTAISTPLNKPLRGSHCLIAINWQSDQTVRLHGRHFYPCLTEDGTIKQRDRWMLQTQLARRGVEVIQFALPNQQGLASQLLTPAALGSTKPMGQQQLCSETESGHSHWLLNDTLYPF